MTARFDLAVFDVDGTLLDTTEGVISAVKYTIDHFGLEMLTEDSLKKFIGPPIQRSFSEAYELEGDIIQKTADVFREHYKNHDLLKAVPYEGIYDAMEWICDQNIKIAVATYKRQDYAQRILREFGFDRFTDIMNGADNENKLSKRDIIKKCITESGVNDHSRVVMIGDSDNDAVGAADLGINFIAVTYGFGFADRKDAMKFPNCGVADSPRELKNFF
ncbi:MAG: HAD hydrolase-like protein [Oscillospiraceae bacterium]|nr:HAD hydrolase-like protein [Oscillospiraceae bacterium]